MLKRQAVVLTLKMDTHILWNNKLIPSIYKCNGIRAVPIGNEEMVSTYSLHYILQEAFVDKDFFFIYHL